MRRAQGFSLVEVLLAVLVLGISLMAFFAAVGQGTSLVADAREYEIARTLMNQVDLLEPLDLDDFQEGERSGSFGGDFPTHRWRRIITLQGKEEDEFYHIETRIEWGSSQDPRVERVETYLHLPTARRGGWIKEPAR